jgi:hypothetical protein
MIEVTISVRLGRPLLQNGTTVKMIQKGSAVTLTRVLGRR